MNKPAKSCSKLALAVAAAVSAASIAVVKQADAAQMERCYGIALAGQNDCAGGNHECAGRATKDYDPASFKWVAKGTCNQIRAGLRRRQ